MKELYNGYRFSPDSDISVFNASMCLYYLGCLRENDQEPLQVLDPSVLLADAVIEPQLDAQF